MPKTLLIVDDSQGIRDSIRRALEPTQIFEQILDAQNGAEALEVLVKERVDLLITDIQMPVMDGFKLLASVRNMEPYKHLPVIFLTSQSDSDQKIKGLQGGANDYVTKPFEPEELEARVRNLLTMKELKDELAQKNLEMSKANEKLEQLSVTDELTGLWNRRYLWKHLTEELKKVDRYHLCLACLVIDIDNFKTINDSHGHMAGDHILAEVARIIRSECRSHDLVARFGGEEFVMLLYQTEQKGGILMAERLIHAVRNHTFTPDHQTKLNATISIGVAAYPSPGIRNSSDLIKRADTALYRAKWAGKNRAETCEPAP